ncbi:MAG TPA: sugar transferase [Clostridiales bacterium]|nr:sugar transferase [Clostridiales bacterium]
MFLIKWEDLPDRIRTDAVRPYYDLLQKKKGHLVWKRLGDIFVSLILIVVLIIPMIIIGIVVKAGSKGPLFFTQRRVTTNGKIFKILKFRTMVDNAEKLGGLITEAEDSRITKNGKFLRKYRLDELPQVFNVLVGQMSLVGTRPEVPKYVAKYQPEMYATLLTPAGVTSFASIDYRDNDELFTDRKMIEKNYLEIILPEKMKLNLEYYYKFNVLYDLKIMFKTVIEVF